MTYHPSGALVFATEAELADLMVLVSSGAQARARNGYRVTGRQRSIVSEVAVASLAARGHPVVQETPPVPECIPEPEQPCTTREAAELLGVSQRQVRRYADRYGNQLGACKVAGRITMDRQAVIDFRTEIRT